MSGIHASPSPLAGQTVKVDIGKGPVEYRVEDYWDRVTGGSWMFAEGNPAALTYAMRTVFSEKQIPTDDEVLYGKIGPFGQLVHISEVVPA